jgi:DNA-binding MarR family transcriptional regulator
MHSDGLIERVSDDRDGRAQLIVLTPQGRRAFRRAAAIAAATVQEVFGSLLEPSQLEQLMTLLERLRDGTQQPWTD